MEKSMGYFYKLDFYPIRLFIYVVMMLNKLTCLCFLFSSFYRIRFLTWKKYGILNSVGFNVIVNFLLILILIKLSIFFSGQIDCFLKNSKNV